MGNGYDMSEIARILGAETPRSREEIMVWVLENSDLVGDCMARWRVYSERMSKSKIKIDVGEIIIERWVHDVHVRFPDLYKAVPHRGCLKIYIGGVHVYNHQLYKM